MLGTSAAGETLTPEPTNDTYNFVTHYRVHINSPPESVWPFLIDFKSWMYEFELSTISGETGSAGQILRLYPDQDFKIQVTQVIPNEMIAVVNLPITFRDEFGTGVGVFTLHETDAGSEVALTMSRRYTWKGEGENPLRATRESAQFHEQTRSMWQRRFLARLKELAEGSPDDV